MKKYVEKINNKQCDNLMRFAMSVSLLVEAAANIASKVNHSILIKLQFY